MELSVQFISESQGICYPQSAKNLSSVQKPEYLKGGVAYIYIYMYMYMYVYTIHIYIVYIYMNIYIYIFMYIYTSICTFPFVSVF